MTDCPHCKKTVRKIASAKRQRKIRPPVKYRIKNRSGVPYGGAWKTHDRLTGVKVEGYIFDFVVERLKENRRANGVPIGLQFEEEVEQWLCEDHPDECEAFDPNLPPKLSRSLSLASVVHGTRVMIAHKLAGSPLVSQDEANRRAAICAGCKWNVQMTTPCGGVCEELKSLVEKIIGSRRTPHYSELKSCGICQCYAEAACWLPLEIQRKGLTDEQKNQFNAVDWCWKRYEADQK